MEPQNWWLCLIILLLANFRLTVLISDDDAPYGVMRKIRSFLKREAKTKKAVQKSEVHKGIDCKRCSSYWSGIILAIWVFIHSYMPFALMAVVDISIVASAFSGATILLVRAFPPKG